MFVWPLNSEKEEYCDYCCSLSLGLELFLEQTEFLVDFVQYFQENNYCRDENCYIAQNLVNK